MLIGRGRFVQKGLSYIRHLNRAGAGLVAITLLLLIVMPAGSIKAEGQGFSQGYSTKDDQLVAGMAVQLSITDNQNDKYIERGSSQNPERIIGIASSPSSNIAVVGSTKNQIYVQSSGQVVAYVSDLGGVVKKGDLLTISPLKGVLQKVNNAASAEMATALEDADLSKAEDVKIDGGSTKTESTKVNKILINLDRHTFQSNQNTSNTLSRVSRALVGKDVGELRVLVSLLVFALLLVVEGGIVYGAISSSLTSLGRNPMAGKAIKRELVRVLLVALAILLIGLGVVYIILWV
jgi:hypothetical protein